MLVRLYFGNIPTTAEGATIQNCYNSCIAAGLSVDPTVLAAITDKTNYSAIQSH